MSERKRRTISLFSGAMGLDLGLERAGLETAICQDFEKSCAETIRANGRKVLYGDVRKIEAKFLLKEAGIERGEAFLLCGGPPCQPFSVAGKRLGINDPRGSLFADFMRIVRYARPRFVVMENVKGLATSPTAGGKKFAEDGEETVLDVILDEMRSAGYETVHGILNAVDYGVPQFRERLIIIGSRDGERIFLPLPTTFRTHQNPELRWKTLGDALNPQVSDHEGLAPMSDERKRLIALVPEGGNWKDLPETERRKALGGAYSSGGGKTGFCRRLSFSEPSPTLLASPSQKSTVLCHPTEDRYLSVREYARIQQFPDEWKFSGTVAERYRQIGNAVPVGLAEAIGKALVATADGNATVRTKRFG